MSTIRDIAKVLVQKHHLAQVDAEMFLQQMVEVINDGLMKDRQVKIKGFGTFKVLSVKERSSVNVNTGERVLIGEHDKVTFTPDNVMRDLVNKPFSQFDTVILEDNSPLLEGDISVPEDIEEEETISESTAEVRQDQIIADEIIAESEIPVVENEAPINDDEASTVEEEPAEGPVEEEPAEEEPVEEAPAEEEDVPTIEEEPVEEDAPIISGDSSGEFCPTEKLPTTPCRNIFIYYSVMINIILVIIAFALGYLSSENKWFETVPEQKNVVNVEPKKETKAEPKKDVKVEPKENAKAEPKKEVEAEPKPKEEVQSEPQKEVKVEQKTEEQSNLHAYDYDARVRTGAYYIIGTAQTVTVKEGQTLEGISKTYLGPGMECYIEVYNNTKTVKAGDKLRIPVLKTKKSMNRK